MTQKEKLIQKFHQNPASLCGRDIQNLLLWHGFESFPGKGSHTVYKRGDINFSIPLHHGDCLPVYKRKIAKLLKSL